MKKLLLALSLAVILCLPTQAGMVERPSEHGTPSTTGSAFQLLSGGNFQLLNGGSNLCLLTSSSC